jgi:hypothetical protein
MRRQAKAETTYEKNAIGRAGSFKPYTAIFYQGGRRGSRFAEERLGTNRTSRAF